MPTLHGWQVAETDFILHFGDLSYAIGRGVLWESFGNLIDPFASRAPYMVSVGYVPRPAITRGGRGRGPRDAAHHANLFHLAVHARVVGVHGVCLQQPRVLLLDPLRGQGSVRRPGQWCGVAGRVRFSRTACWSGHGDPADSWLRQRARCGSGVRCGRRGVRAAQATTRAGATMAQTRERSAASRRTTASRRPRTATRSFGTASTMATCTLSKCPPSTVRVPRPARPPAALLLTVRRNAPVSR